MIPQISSSSIASKRQNPRPCSSVASFAWPGSFEPSKMEDLTEVAGSFFAIQFQGSTITIETISEKSMLEVRGIF